jgi:hypothetical protein
MTFDPKRARTGVFTVVGAGRTALIRSLVHAIAPFTFVIGFNPGERTNHALSYFCPPATAYDRFDAEQVQRVADWCGALRAHRQDVDTLMVVDSLDRAELSALRPLHTTSRHKRVCLVQGVGSVADLPPVARHSTRLWFVTQVEDEAERRRVWECCAPPDMDLPRFLEVLDAHTSSGQCLVVGTGGEMLAWSPPPITEPFRAAAPAFHALSEYYSVGRTESPPNLDGVHPS